MRGWNDELNSGVAAAPHIHANTRFEEKYACSYLENYSSNTNLSHTRISSHKLAINKQSPQEVPS